MRVAPSLGAAFAAVVVIALVAVLAARTKRDSPAEVPSQSKVTADPVSVRLSGPFGSGFAGEMVALGAGLFAREGLSVTLRPSDGYTDSLSHIVAGEDTFGVASAEHFLTTRAKGAPIVAFAAGFLKTTVVFYALDRSGIRSPFDFVGRRIGYQPEQDTAIIYRAMMDRLQISRSKVQEIPVQVDASQLLDGRVEVLPGHVGVEAYSLTRTGKAYQVVSPPDYGLHVPGTVYFTSERTIRDHPDIVRRFLRAVIAGWELTYADEQRTIPLIVAFDTPALSMDMVHFQLEHQRDSLRPYGTRFGESDESQWRLLEDILIQQGQIKDPINLTSGVTAAFLRDVYRSRSQGLVVKDE
jgi:ABC-type nitrate/sulfonate/bicarbonate transport system substrate-binding protein